MAKFYKSYSRIMVEIDLPKCTRTYGVAPCTAAVGVTGADKCFNCIRTCQDRLNYDEGTLTLRLADQAPDDYYTVAGEPVPVINNILSMSITAAIVKPGVDAGERETLTVNCIEHADSDTVLDPYVSERSYDPMKQGTFWQRLRARYVSYEGFPLRLYRGYAGQDRDIMDVYHYSLTSVTSDGKSAKLTAKDPFTLADSKKSQAPKLSNGSLLTDITAIATSLTLTPTGVGDYEYPTSGFVCLSGSEVVPFTRVSDTVTITRDATVAKAHEAGAAVQLVLAYSAMSGAAIIADLLTNYTEGIDAAWIDDTAWLAEMNSYYGTLFTAKIAAPTSVATLVNELIAQLPAVFFWDSQEQQFRLQALRPADPSAPLIDDSSFVEQTFKVSEQPNARADMIWTYFGQKDPTKKLDEVNNYATTLANVDPDSGVDYNTDAIKTIYSRWIPSTARGTAQVLNATLLSRYRDPPRQISFSLWRNVLRRPNLGDVYQVTHPFLQDAYGAQVTIPIQLCTVKPDDSSYVCSGQEIIYKPQGGDAESGVRYLYIDHDITNVNLRALYDSVFVSIEDIVELHVVIGSDATIGSTTVDQYALEVLVGDWPVTVAIFLDFNGGMLLGRGAKGLDAGYSPTAGTPQNGGPAFHVTRPVTITGTGIIGGGGGAGARFLLNTLYAFAGAGGAGYLEGVNGAAYGSWVGTVSTQPTRVEGGRSAANFPSDAQIYVDGGALGADGMNTFGVIGTVVGLTSGSIGHSSSGGHAVDGYSNLTIVGGGIDIRGVTT